MILFRSYSHHSLLSAVPKIPELVEAAKARGYTAIALTDEDTTSGLVEFYEYCKKAEIKPILGTALRIPNLTQEENSFGRSKDFGKLAILAKDESGYKSILKLVSLARTVQEKPDYHITLQNLQTELKTGNFWVLIATGEHEIGQKIRQGKPTQAKEILLEYSKLLGAENILLEALQNQTQETLEETQKHNLRLADIAKDLSIKTVLSPAPRYLNPEDDEVFRTVLAIRNQVKLFDIKLQRDFSLPTSQDLQKQYAYLAEGLDSSDLESQVDIQIRTDYDKFASEAFFPKFPLAKNQNSKDLLRWETYIGLITKFHPTHKALSEWKEIYPYEKLEDLIRDIKMIQPDTQKLLGYPKDYWQKKTIQDYVDRVEYELDVIFKKGYPDYFLVFSDIMRWCRDNNIVINTRGSAAGCLVGYLTGINILDALVYDIPFERFLNPLRPSAPDIDGDFADDRRAEVIEYIKAKYGAENVTQIITFGTMLPRAVVRDVGRVLGISYRKCDRLSKLIPTAPQGKKTTFEWAMETSEEFRIFAESDEDAKRIIGIAKKIEGNYRHASSHAAGVIISPTKMTDYAAVQWDSEHIMPIIQYDMRNAEKMGLIKLDILGIRNLAILGNAVDLAEQRKSQKIDLLNIDLLDEKTYKLLSRGQTMGLFQLSGPAMTKYLVNLEPEKVQDLMAMVALYRPGPMVNIPEYIKRRKNPKLTKYYHPKMAEWMEPSYGILVYQDDVLYTAIRIAGYDWKEADVLRKGMGKKIKEVIDSQHIKFVEGAQKHSGLSEEEAEQIWDLVVPFSAYGFNKAHSSNYGMIAYWTAYMKANFTVEFMTSLMTSESGNLDKIANAIRECESLGIQVLPPDVNKSYDNYYIEDDKTIRYGLGSVKNLGSDIIKYIIQERQENGDYKNIDDFVQRMASCNGFNKRSLEALIWSGSLDQITADLVS